MQDVQDGGTSSLTFAIEAGHTRDVFSGKFVL
jgi:hypothetical protein